MESIFVCKYRYRFSFYFLKIFPFIQYQNSGMERVWMSEFRRVFSQFFTELWSIQPVDKKPTTHSNIRLHMFVDSAKVRFCCEVII